MHRIFAFLLFSLLGASASFAQENLNSQLIESKTLNYYYNSNWDSLIVIGERAQKHGVDYYYLNYRLALAHFFKNNFFTASYYFNKAYKQNKSAFLDAYFKEKYFLSLVYSKQNVTANSLLEAGDTLMDMYDLKYKGSLYIAGVVGIARPIIAQAKLRNSDNSFLSETYYQQSLGLANIIYDGIIAKNVSVDFAYSYAQLQMVAALENNSTFNIRDFVMQQNTLNVKPKYWLNRTNSFSLALGFSSIAGKPYGVLDSSTSFDYYTLSQNSFMLGAEYYHLYKNISMGLNAAYSNFGFEEQQMQAGVSFSWFLKGNLDLYSNTQAHIFSDSPGSFRPIIYQKIGFKARKNLWIEASGIYGDVKNFTLLSNNFTYEIPNHTYGIASAKAIYILNKNFNLFFGAQYWWKYTEKKESSFDNTEHIQIINYQQINFIGGLQWKF